MSPIDKVKERCEQEIESKAVEIEVLTTEIEDGREELKLLKSQLYSKFGDAIRLDYD
jgi:chaperonin cofactor prefoldin